MRYRWFIGGWSWLLMRITGGLLILYLGLHIYVLHFLAKGGEEFDRLMHTMQQPIFKLLEIGLLGVVIYHSLNGIRILVIDFGRGAWYHKKLFWLLMAIGIAIFLVGAIPMLQHMMS